MSETKKIRRNTLRFCCVTPKSPSNSPVLQYYTPSRFVKKTPVGRFHKVHDLKSPRRLSAECFFQKERLMNRHRFYVSSPRTPLYKRCQVIKKRLMFDDDDAEENNKIKIPEYNVCSVDLNNKRHSAIPIITFSSPKDGEGKDKEEKTSRVSRDNLVLKSSSTYPMEMTPNIMRLIHNVYDSMDSLKVLGKGRYGCVVEYIYKGSKIAIKVIDISKKRLTGCLQSEINCIGLDHLNVINVHYILQPPNVPSKQFAMVFMEHVDNAMNLQTLLDSEYDDRFLTPQRITRYTLHICEGLQYIHSRRILHLDVKPKNILVCPDEVCKICDYGSSVNFDSKFKKDPKGVLYQHCGTVQYCAPEILCGQVPTTASDIYSLGITMWQLMHRKVPYGNSIREESLIYRVVKEDLRPQIVKSLSFFERYYTDIYISCWAREAARRCDINLVLKKLYEYKNSMMPLR